MKFIVVKGSGESDLSRHPGSFHYALADANGIHKYNLILYTSVLPEEAERVSIDEVDMPPHGTTLYTIMANAEGEFGDTINAGIIYAWLYLDKDLSKKVGGFVCEVTNKGTVAQLEDRMRAILNESYNQTFAKEKLYMGEPEVIIESLEVTKRFGNSLVAIVFIND